MKQKSPGLPGFGDANGDYVEHNPLPYPGDPVKAPFFASRRGFSNQSNYVGPVSEKFTLPSKTVPDMSITVRDMLNRHLNGGSVKGFQTTNVPLDSMIPIGFEKMDIFDRAELKVQVADFIATTRGKMQTARAAREQEILMQKATDAAEARILAKSRVDTGASSSDVAL